MIPVSVQMLFPYVFFVFECRKSFRSLRAGSQVFSLLMLFLCVILLQCCCSLQSCRMLIVVMLGKWSDDSVLDVRLYSVLDTVVVSDEDVCCSVVFGTVVGVFLFSVMWFELLMTSAVFCPLWSSVYECHNMESACTSPVRTECGMFVMCCAVCSVVCLCQLICSAWMCCLEEVYRCLLL